MLYLNDYDILTGKRLDDYVTHIRRFLDQGIPFAGIGVQGHLHGDSFDADALGHAAFEGEVSLARGGGFASVRSPPGAFGDPDTRALVVEARGRGRVYFDHLRRLIEPLHAEGFEVLFWGDILRSHPELVAELPADRATALLPIDDFPPAVGQGAIGITARGKDAETRAALAPILDEATALALAAERAFLAALDGSCRTPIAGHATVTNGELAFHGEVLKADGSEVWTTRRKGRAIDAEFLSRTAGLPARLEVPYERIEPLRLPRATRLTLERERGARQVAARAVGRRAEQHGAAIGGRGASQAVALGRDGRHERVLAGPQIGRAHV